ncbi:MAG: hypothetical protein RMJ56_01815 [Gemmataceae bacterium]|nr:hypothetical protein [Gemmata sp.]MDW8196320.1 hypothetical protein [Gemmataceae bacterium]
MPEALRLAPRLGLPYAVPWPTPLIPGASIISFWGVGNQITQEFTLPAEASLRLAVQQGPFVVHVRCRDGSEPAPVAPLSTPGLALAAIPAAGTYYLEVEATGAWGISIVFFTPAPAATSVR